MRARFALALGILLALAGLNIGAFYWGAQARERVFGELRLAIRRHAILTETKAALEDHYKRVKVVSDLLGVEAAVLGAEERTRTLQSIELIQQRLRSSELTATHTDSILARLLVETDSLAESWTTFYSRQAADPAKAIAELVLTAEPLALRLLTIDLPAAIHRQNGQVEHASAAFVYTDRTSSRVVWGILIVSGLLSGVLAYSLSRDLVRAIAALKAGVERFGAGELTYRVQVERCDELAEVGESLNEMAGRLRHVRDELQLRNDELAHLAFRDSLTKLANRSLFRDRVIEELLVRDRNPEEMAVLFIDLDNFKAVNDTLGHSAGDRLLVDVAARLLDATRGSDTVARLGGDEFAMLLPRVRGINEALIVVERAIGALKAPFTLDGRSVRVTASIGVACGREGDSADDLLRNADVAMYRAKAHGKGRYEVFEPEMHAALVDRLELEEELRDALDRGELALVFQPVIDLQSGSAVGFEALARWNHPKRGPVPPSEFIPLAEESGVILSIGRWVLHEACRQAVTWECSGVADGPVFVSVNVSGRQLECASLVQDVSDALTASGLDPRRLILEMTESVIMRDSATMLTRLQDLKTIGVRLAVDDFGTGYSSLAYLQRFPVDILKIDKAFVSPVGRGGNDAALARTIIALGETLQLRMVAEGIERADQFIQLRSLGCALGQGYLFSRPLSPADAAALLTGVSRGLAAISHLPAMDAYAVPQEGGRSVNRAGWPSVGNGDRGARRTPRGKTPASSARTRS